MTCTYFAILWLFRQNGELWLKIIYELWRRNRDTWLKLHFLSLTINPTFMRIVIFLFNYSGKVFSQLYRHFERCSLWCLLTVSFIRGVSNTLTAISDKWVGQTHFSVLRDVQCINNFNSTISLWMKTVSGPSCSSETMPLTVGWSSCLEGLVGSLCGGARKHRRLLSKHYNHDLNQTIQVWLRLWKHIAKGKFY